MDKDALIEKVRGILSSRSNVEETVAFGGAMFKMNGNMLVQVTSKSTLVLNLQDKTQEVLAMPNTAPHKLGANIIKTMAVHTDPSAASDEDLANLVNMAADAVEKLPAKAPKAKK